MKDFTIYKSRDIFPQKLKKEGFMRGKVSIILMAGLVVCLCVLSLPAKKEGRTESMPGKILQLNFKFSVSRAEYEQAVAPLASEFAAVSGLRWKIWMINEAEREAGGIYLFEDEASAKALLEGPLAAKVTSHPALSDFSVKLFDVMEDLTAITRGPVK